MPPRNWNTQHKDISMIYHYSIIFKSQLNPPLPPFSPIDLEEAIQEPYSLLLEQLIMSLLHCYPNPSKRKIKY
jgi:hypothetical protein